MAARQEKHLVQQKYKRIDLTPTGLLMEAYYAQNPCWRGGGQKRARTRRPSPHPFMKCFSNSRFDRSAPSSVSITDFALLTGSSM